MMPQKAIRGSQFERARIAACNVIGQMNTGVCLIKGEPHADMLQAVEVPKSALAALVHGQRAIGYLDGMLKNVHPVREKMLEYVREGFSCATEVVVHMVKELGRGNRRSHRIVATFVRMAREKGLKAFETTGELLDEAARFVDEKEPRIDTDTLRRLLDPEVFIAEHKHAGGTAPEEEKRLIAARKKSLKDARKRQTERKKRIAKGEEMLQREIDAILNG